MPIASNDQKCHVAPHFDYPDLGNAVMPLMTPSAALGKYHWYHVTQKLVSVASHDLNDLDIRNVMVPLKMPSGSCDANAGAPNFYHLNQKCNGATDDTITIIWCWHQWCHILKKKSYVPPHFDHHDLNNTMGHWWNWWLYMMPVPMVSHDQQSNVASFWLSWSMKCSGSIDDAISITWCQC